MRTGEAVLTLREQFALPKGRDARVFALSALVDALGSGLYMPVSALFFVEAVGLRPTTVGLGLAVAGLAGVVGSAVSGVPVDRFGPRPTLLVLHALRAAVFFCYPLVRGVPGFVAVVCAVAFADRIARPAQQALVAGIADEEDRVAALGFVRVVRNLGYAVAGLAASVALGIGTREAFVALVVADGVSFLGAGVVLARVGGGHAPEVRTPARAGYARVLQDRPYLLMTAFHSLLALHLALLLVGLPLWVTRRTDAPDAMAGLVFVINTVLVVLLTLPVSRSVRTVADGGRSMRRAGLVLALSCVLLATTDGAGAAYAVTALCAVAVLETMGETWHAVGGWCTSLGMAPPEVRGSYLAVYALGFSVQEVLGTALITAVVEHVGAPGMLALAGVFAFAGLGAGRLTAGWAPPAAAEVDPVQGAA